jgi:signal transduction histidine kinase
LVKTRTADLSLAFEKLENGIRRTPAAGSGEFKNPRPGTAAYRPRFARRIDIQHLTGIAYISKWLEKRLGSLMLPERKNASEIAHEIHQAIRRNGRDRTRFESDVLETDGLAEALHELARYGRRTCFPSGANFTVWMGDSLWKIKIRLLQLYRIAQECIHNAIRHGKAQRIEIDLAQKRKTRVLTITDNGTGFSIRKNPGRMGLPIMKHRAGTIGAD